MKPALALALALLAAGCLAEPATPASTGGAPAAGLPLTLGPPAHVTPAGHRVAEYMVAQSPLDPQRLLVAVSSDYDDGTGASGCAFLLSTDGGHAWSTRKVPGFDKPHTRFDAWASFDREGRAHAICEDTMGPNAQVWVLYSRSDDGGSTWSPAIRIPDRVASMSTDKDVLLAASDGTLYVAFGESNGDAANPSGLVVTRSHDGGTTWERPTLLSRSAGIPNGIVETSDGAVHLLHFAKGESEIVLTTTRDHGDNWTSVIVAPHAVAPRYDDTTRWVDPRPWAALPALALAAPTQHLFVASQSWNDTTGRFGAHVYRSDDGGTGASWREVAAPSFASSTCASCHVTHPTLATDAAGRLALEVQLVNDGALRKEVWLATSADEGATWTTPLRLSATDVPAAWVHPREWTPQPGVAPALVAHVASDPADAPQTALGVALSTAVGDLQFRWDGEYWGMAATPEGFLAMWIDHAEDGVPQLWAATAR